MSRSVVCLLLAWFVAAAAPPASAQAAPEKPSEVERALRRRVESWLRERGQKRLACRMCDCVADRVQWCGDCERTGVDPKRLERALLRYLRPSFRDAEDEARWARELLQRLRGQWGEGQPFAREDLEVVDVLLSRDAAWVQYAVKGGGPGRSIVQELWVREGGTFYLGAGSGPAEPLVEHVWFVVGTFSLQRLYEAVERLQEAETAAGITELERTRRRDARAAAERELATRTLADLGRVLDVQREPMPDGGRDGTPPFWYWATVRVGASDVCVTVDPEPGESSAALEARLAGLGVGTLVFVRGRIHDWKASPTERRFEFVRLVEGAVERAD